jgi:carbon-monoxide dehydrogenase large subunit
VTDAHGRDHVTDAAMAMSKDGKILGLHVKTTANLGAYLSTFAPAVPTFLYGTLLNGVYTIGAIKCEVTGVFTNTTAVDAYRGAGRPEACYVLERMANSFRFFSTSIIIESYACAEFFRTSMRVITTSLL